MDLKVNQAPHIKNSDKIAKELKKMAYPRHLKKEMSHDEFFEVMQRKGMTGGR